MSLPLEIDAFCKLMHIKIFSNLYKANDIDSYRNFFLRFKNEYCKRVYLGESDVALSCISQCFLAFAQHKLFSSLSIQEKLCIETCYNILHDYRDFKLDRVRLLLKHTIL